MKRKIGLLALASAAAVVFGPTGHAYAAGFSYAYVAPPSVDEPGAYTATLRAVASVDGPLTITVTGLDGTSIDKASDCALTDTGLDCLLDAVAGVPVAVDLAGAYTGSLIHLRTTASDAAGPVSFQADTLYGAIPAGGFTPPPVPPIPTPPPVPAPPALPPIPSPPIFTPPVFTPPVFTPPVFTPPVFTPPVFNPPPAPTPPLVESVARRQTLDGQRAKVLAYVNKHRVEVGAPQLHLVDDLDRSAQRYAAKLAGDAVFSHTDGSVLTQRIEASGYRFHFVGENLGMGQTSPWRIVHDWMHSPEHKANMLDDRFTDAGIGMAVRPDGQIVWCLHLGEPA